MPAQEMAGAALEREARYEGSPVEPGQGQNLNLNFVLSSLWTFGVVSGDA
jgi:hypothetical protein